MKVVIPFAVLLVVFSASALPSCADPAAERSDHARAVVKLAGLAPEVQEKKRVPKPENEKPKQDDQDDEEEDESCLGMILESMLLGMCEDDEEEVQAATLTPEPHVEEFVVFAGLIDPIDPGAEDIALWSAPGGDILGGEVTGRFPRGARVEVQERRLIDRTPWFRVEGSTPYAFSGWVLAHNVAEVTTTAPGIAEETELAPGTPEEPVSTYGKPAVPSLGRPIWQVLADFSWAAPNEEDIHEEYKRGGFRSGVRMRMCPIGSFQFGLGLTHSHTDGDPQFNYKISYTAGDIDSSRDIPSDSDMKILAIELHAGQYFPIDNGPGYFTWSVGPTVFRVEETAQIYFVEFEDHNVVDDGQRRDKLAKWRVGGDVRLEICYLAGGQVPIGVNLGLSVIPWSAKNDKSLTLDWIESEVFVVFYAGLTIGYSFF